MKTKTAVILITCTLIGAVAVLHAFGYKIYGYPTMYRTNPPIAENWQKVISYDKDAFELKSGERVPIRPFYFKEEALAMPTDELSSRLFKVPFDDLYVRKEKEDWIVRVGNSYLCAFPEFFPERTYGYYESEVRLAIDLSETSYPIDSHLTGFESEEALRSYYEIRKNGEQNQAVEDNAGQAPPASQANLRRASP